MIVSDIYEDVRSVTHYADQSLNFSRITDAVETLANKGNFDILLGYLTIKPAGNIITLPPDVETPLRVNIDDNPTFTRGRVYEFALNGPGSSAERTDWGWEDKGTVSVIAQPPTPQSLSLVFNVADNNKHLTIYYRDGNNQPQTFTFTLGSGATTSGIVASVDRVVKDVTQFPVTLQTVGNDLLAQYQPNETEPQYRQIRISKTGGTAYIMFRRNRFEVTSMGDFIPIRSKMGLIYMVKAHQAYREDRFQDGQGYEKQSVALAQEEQQQRHSYGAGQGGESPTIRNLSLANRDSVIVADIYDEASQILGPVGESAIFDKLTEAINLLDGKANWDGKIGYVDIATDASHTFITLPRYVDRIIKMNICGRPAQMKSKWYEFHLNGPGEGWLPCNSWMDEGEVTILQDTIYPQKFVAIPDLAVDEGTVIRAFGRYNGKEIFFPDGPSNSPKHGFPIECSQTGTVTSTQLCDDVQRIDKAESKGFIQLVGVDNLGQHSLIQGFWQPDETSPHYRRIKLPVTGTVVRLMYRKNTLKISSLTDPIHLKSSTAILCALRSINALSMGKLDEATAYEVKATQLMSERNLIDNQSEVRDIEFIDGNEGDSFIDF